MTAQPGIRRVLGRIGELRRAFVVNLFRRRRASPPPALPAPEQTVAPRPEDQVAYLEHLRRIRTVSVYDDIHEADEEWDDHSERLDDESADQPQDSTWEQHRKPLLFRGSRQHLRLELKRVGYLVRVQLRSYWGTMEPLRQGEDWSHATYHTHVQTYIGSDPLLTDQVAEWAQNTIDEDLARSEQLQEAIDRRRAELGAEQGRLRLMQLAERFDLSPYEMDMLLICLLPDLYRRYRLYFAYLQGDTALQSQIAQPQPNLDTLRDILRDVYPGYGEALKADQTVLKHRLIVLDGGAVSVSPIPQTQVDTRVARFLLGDNCLDTRLNGIVTVLDQPEGQLLPDDPVKARVDEFRDWHHNRTERRLKRARDFYRRWRVEESEISEVALIGATLLLVGPYGVGKQRFAQAICAGKGPLLLVQTAAALNSPLGWETIVDLVYREGRLRDAAVYWVNCEMLLNSLDDRYAPQWAYLMSAATTYSHLTFLASEVAWEPKGRFLGEHTFTHVDLPAPGYPLRVRLWQRLLETEPTAKRRWTNAEVKELAERLANGFQFTAGQMEDAMRSARSIAHERAPNQPVVTEEEIFTGCRRQVGRRLTSLTRPFGAGTKPTFADLLLPDATCKQLDELKQLVLKRKAILSERGIEERLSRGKGIVAMFTGTSGTGKTTAAEVLASEAGVDLYKVDLSAVVSKYVGDTEKQLNQVFAEAEAANAMLFFDEGDALFGKRGEVKDAQDRWANQEVNFLLQRIEEYTGVVILATNFAQNIDEAFRRRIHMVIEFPFPDRGLRRQIWRQMLTRAKYPELSEQEVDLLASFRLSGGSIQNIVLNAVSLEIGAEDQRMKPLILAITREYQKLGRPITRTEFGREYFKWIVDEKLL